ncbi:MAG: hypothetical protein OXQ84_02605 [bacterium]|nr:hypothetical protein [bacterium]
MKRGSRDVGAVPESRPGLQRIRVGEHAAQGDVPVTFRLTHDIADDLRLLWQEPRVTIIKGAGTIQES